MHLPAWTGKGRRMPFARVLPVALLLAGCRMEWSPLFDERADEEALRNVAIASTSEALTFARTDEDRLLAVLSYEQDAVTAVDLTARTAHVDPIDAYHALGYAALRASIEEAASLGDTIVVPVSTLSLPVDLGAHHIAAGTNFPEHASETGVTGGPYLFPKLVAPTPFDAEVSLSHGEGLLDYEVELGFVTLETLREGDDPARMGLVLCNDYTDRDTLLRHLDPDDVASGMGFTTGKSFPGYLPVGNLFVIPDDFRAFSAELELSLYVNGRLRQRELVGRAIWDADALLDETWARRDVTWAHRGTRVALVPTDAYEIGARTLLMTGTPPGVVFNELNVEQKLSGLFDYLFGGQGESIPDHAIDNYIRDARAMGIYLGAGDDVFIHVPRLGVVRNLVVR